METLQKWAKYVHEKVVHGSKVEHDVRTALVPPVLCLASLRVGIFLQTG